MWIVGIVENPNGVKDVLDLYASVAETVVKPFKRFEKEPALDEYGIRVSIERLDNGYFFGRDVTISKAFLQSH